MAGVGGHLGEKQAQEKGWMRGSTIRTEGKIAASWQLGLHGKWGGWLNKSIRWIRNGNDQTTSGESRVLQRAAKQNFHRMQSGRASLPPHMHQVCSEMSNTFPAFDKNHCHETPSTAILSLLSPEQLWWDIQAEFLEETQTHTHTGRTCKNNTEQRPQPGVEPRIV